MVHSTISATFGKETPVLVGGVARSTSPKKQTSGKNSGKSKREKRNEREEKVRKTRKRKKQTSSKDTLK